MSKNKIFFINLILLLINISQINSANFGFEVKPGKTYCVGEYLTEDTVAIFAMSSNQTCILKVGTVVFWDNNIQLLFVNLQDS